MAAPRARVTFIGCAADVGWCAPTSADPIDAVWLEPAEVGDAIDGEVIVCLAPAAVDPSLVAGSEAKSIAWLGLDGAAPGDLGAYDRVIVTGAVPSAVRPWRCGPLPVADDLFAVVAEPEEPPAVVAPGRATPYRDLVLQRLSEDLEIDRRTRTLPLPAAAIVVHVHDEASAAGFPLWLPAALAAGALLVSEPLEPQYGLEPGIDYLEGASAAELQVLVGMARERPAGVLPVRRRGQAKVATLRASRAWPALLDDLRRDLAAFG